MGYVRKALEKGYLEHPGLYAVLTTCLSFSSFFDGACVPCCLFLSTGCYHVCIQIDTMGRDDKIKWLDFGTTPDPENLQPHPGFVKVK